MKAAAHICVRLRDDTIVDGEFTTIEAIHVLQQAIEQLREMAAPVRDLSFGESPMPVLGPSSTELAEFIRRN